MATSNSRGVEHEMLQDAELLKSADDADHGDRRSNEGGPDTIRVSADRAFRVLAEAVSNALFVTDPLGRRIYSNGAFSEFIAPDRSARSSAPPPTFVPKDQVRQFWHTVSRINLGATSTSTAIELLGTEWDRVLVVFTVVAWPYDNLNSAVWIANETYECTTGQNLDLGSGAVGGMSDDSDTIRTLPLRASSAHALTAREHEVIGELLAGHRVATIARNLDVSAHTVQSHLRSIFRKLDAHSQSEVIERFRRIPV